MRVFRLVLTVALAAAVFANEAVTTETDTELATVQGSVDGAVEVTPDAPVTETDAELATVQDNVDETIEVTPEAPVSETDAELAVVQGTEDEAIEITPEEAQTAEADAELAAVQGTVDEVVDVTPEAANATDADMDEIKSKAADALKRAADSEIAKDNNMSGALDGAANKIGTAGTNTGSTSSASSAASSAKTLPQILQNSNNPNVASIGNLAQNSGLMPTNSINSVKNANPELATMLSALTAGAGISQSMTQCYGSIEGDEDAIQSSLVSLGTSMVNSDSITAAAGVGKALITAAPGATASEKDAMYNLFRIYLDQNANAGKALTTTQQKAYSSLTPECNAAFDEIVTTYQNSKGTVSSLMAGGKSNVTCSNFQDNTTFVDMTLCVWPSAVWSHKEKGIMANITATFTNYGVGLCDVSFYIINLAENIGLKPTWLPDSKKAFPDGIPQGTEIEIQAVVPWTNEIAENKPVVDILKGWSACPNGRATPAPTAARTAEPKIDTEVINSAAACFITDACKTAVTPFKDDQCGAYTQLLTSGCSTCSDEVLMSATKSCLASCQANACGAMAQVTSGAGALSKAVAFVVTLVTAFAFVL